MSESDPGCQHSAGALENGKLSQTTYDRIVQNIIDAGQKGFGEVHPELPCANDLGTPSGGGLVPLDLHDKEKYPDFHKNVMGQFEQIALALDVKGNFSLPFPAWDPFAVALKLNLDTPSLDIQDIPTLTPPQLAIGLGFKIPEIPELAAIFSVPPVPPIDVKIPEINPDFNLPPDWLELFKFQAWPLALPDLVAGLLVPDINFIIGMLKVPPDVCPVIKNVQDAQMFGPANEGDLLKAITTSEMATFTSQCTTVAVTSMLVGDGGPAGVTGNLGTQYKWREAPPAKGGGFEPGRRNLLRSAFKSIFKREPTIQEIQFVHLIGKAEGGWSSSKFPPKAKNSNNIGSVQYTEGIGASGWFQATDTTSSGKPYNEKFAIFSSADAGARAFIKHVYVLRPHVMNYLNSFSNKTEKPPLYKVLYIMSSKAVYGSEYKSYVRDANGNRKRGPDAIIAEGQYQYYDAEPNDYFDRVMSVQKQMTDRLKEDLMFDTKDKSLPVGPFDYTSVVTKAT